MNSANTHHQNRQSRKTEKHYTYREAAALLSIGLRTLQYAVERGEIKRIARLPDPRIPDSELARWVEARTIVKEERPQ